MKTHPLLRAYMAGITFPQMFMLVVLCVFVVARLIYRLPFPIERGIVFPMAVIPNLFGVWNILYVSLGPERRLPIGVHGALLPFLIAPFGILLATSLGFVALTPGGPVFFDTFRVSYAIALVCFAIAVTIYYLVWKHLVSFLNGVLGIA